MTRVKRRVVGEDLMAYVMMAAGALMFAIGIYAVATGSKIVQVEAGWTSVIAGATFIAGGIVTFALGVVTRVLLQLKSVLSAQSVAAPVEAKAPEPAVPVPDLSKPDLPEPEPQEQPSGAEDPLPESSLAAVVEAAPELVAEREPDFRVPPIPRSKPLRPAPPVERKPIAEPPTAPAAPEPVALAEPELPALEKAVHPADDYKLETPSTPEHDLPDIAPEPPLRTTPPATPSLPVKEPAEIDWLDRALADIDEELPIRAPLRSVETSRPISPPAHQALDHESEPTRYDAEPSTAEPLPPAHVAHETAPQVEGSDAAHAPSSAVIGRYEADGVSYVMHADGSIEAQSETGVYRFASMAELRAHIEG